MPESILSHCWFLYIIIIIIIYFVNFLIYVKVYSNPDYTLNYTLLTFTIVTTTIYTFTIKYYDKMIKCIECIECIAKMKFTEKK